MKNIVGQTPRGEDFFPRDKVIDRIYRRLDSGSHIYLAAPRRVGKTSIMRFLQDNPRPGYQFVYVITESASTPEDYYQQLLEEILKSNAISGLAKKKEGVAQLVRQVLGRIEKIKFPWLEVDMQPKEKISFQTAFEQLVLIYASEDDTLVVMIDEFPQTVENIKLKHGDSEAISFLHYNREIRHKVGEKVRFIYTGSIGLPSVVKKLTSTAVINDLNVIEILPLSSEEASQMTKMLLDSAKAKYDTGMIDYLLDTIKWLIPFHIQLAVQELIDVWESTETPLNKSSVDKAIQQLLNIRNDSYFEHYYLRLKDVFTSAQYDFTIRLLHEIAMSDTLTLKMIIGLSNDYKVPDDCEFILESLIYDGYIHFDDSIKSYRFNSYLLQQWWSKKNPK